MLASLSKGGHLRVGMEDVLTLAAASRSSTTPSSSSARSSAGRVAQREPMTPAGGARPARPRRYVWADASVDRGGPRRDLRAPARAELGADVLEVRARRSRR